LRVALDENLPPALARALAALFEGDHEVIHLRIRFGPGLKDVEWIDALSREGRWAVISADRRITKVKAERQAFQSSNLVGFFLSAGLAKSKATKQMERLLALWETMDQTMGIVQGGAMFELPSTSTKLRQLRI
jgi:hypothetical protein